MNQPTDGANNGGLPVSGRFMASRWASILDITPETLMNNIGQHEFRILRFGRTVVIDAKKFWEDVEKLVSGGHS